MRVQNCVMEYVYDGWLQNVIQLRKGLLGIMALEKTVGFEWGAIFCEYLTAKGDDFEQHHAVF